MRPSATRPLSIHGPTVPERRWIRHLAEWQKSGLRGSEWCRKRGLKESAFRFWKKEIPVRALRRRERSCARPTGIHLLAARVVETPRPAEVALLEIVLGRRSIRVSGEFDPAVLRKVIEALEAAP